MRLIFYYAALALLCATLTPGLGHQALHHHDHREKVICALAEEFVYRSLAESIEATMK